MRKSDLTLGRTIDLTPVAPELRGALVMAIMIYPKPDEDPLSLLTYLRLSGRMVVAEADVMNGWVAKDSHPLIGIPIDWRKLNGGKKRCDARIRKRIEAGHLALKHVLADELNLQPRFTGSMRWNQTAAILKICDELNISQPKNFLHRYWYPAFPILHLAAAWTEMRIEAGKRGEAEDDGYRLVTDSAHLIELLNRAQRLESKIAASEIGVREDLLITFRGFNLGSV